MVQSRCVPSVFHALVVPDIDIICCDLLVGSDLITHCGGLHLEYSDKIASR